MTDEKAELIRRVRVAIQSEVYTDRQAVAAINAVRDFDAELFGALKTCNPAAS